jgi:hypothetical protein
VSYPELYSDERVVLQAQNVKVKSVLFEIVLTTRRLVLIDTKKNSIPPQEINLATLKDVESGENAIRDPTITISIITISGNTRQMVLTFSKISGGERRRECEDWVRALRQNITSTIYHPVGQAPAPKETEPAPAEQPMVSAPHRIEATTTPPPKKRIEIARPMKKIVEAPPVMPVPVETTSLPTGSFCNRCGNRVPPESVFCNRCGTPVAPETGAADLQGEKIEVPPPQPAPPAEPAVPQIQITPPPAAVPVEKKERPIEDVIHSIEPLIEDSVPRTTPSPLIPSRQPQYATQPADMARPVVEAPAPQATVPPETTDADAQVPGVLLPAVQWPVLPKTEPVAAEPASPPPAEPAPPPVLEPLPPSPPARKFSVATIAVLALVVLAAIAGVFVLMQQQPAATPDVTPTTIPATTLPQTTVPVVTTTALPAVTPQPVTTPSALIPASGVWVKVTYPNIYSGEIGTPGRLRDISDTGTHFYQISTSDGPVVVNIQKDDGSAAEMVVDIYKDGELVKHSQTIAPKGIIEIQASLKVVTAAPSAAP